MENVRTAGRDMPAVFAWSTGRSVYIGALRKSSDTRISKISYILLKTAIQNALAPASRVAVLDG